MYSICKQNYSGIIPILPEKKAIQTCHFYL
jgi:hypothetical protein